MELPRATVRCGNLECSVLVSFTLSDGSVVVAWQSLDHEAEGSQEPLFANLTSAAPCPSCRSSSTASSRPGHPTAPTYAACHLGHTSKAGRLIEWALYVPKNRRARQCQVPGLRRALPIQRRHAAQRRNGHEGALRRPVKTAEDFDKWVRGAMAELSDNATAPADVTYQKVSDLAQQTRTPSKP